MNDRQNSGSRLLIIILVIVAVGAGVLYFNRTPTVGERLDNATEEMGDGIENAARALDPNPTPAERIGNSLEDAGDAVRDAVE